MNSMAVTWEAVYDDGTVLREKMGAKYAHIDRHRLRSFRLVAPGEILLEMPTGNGRTGHNLVYRRRTMFGGGQKEVWFVVGWVPMGPVVAIQPEQEVVRRGEKFEGGGPLGKVVPTPEEKWLPSHTADARLEVHQITLPSGYVLKR